jgi:peptide/nickel transport system permease protein
VHGKRETGNQKRETRNDALQPTDRPWSESEKAMPVVLWTDALIFLLLAAAVGFALYVRRHEHLRAPWRQVVRSRMGMAAAVLLSVYVIIGLLDSLHFEPRVAGDDGRLQYAAESISVFDWIMTPIRTRVEKTYSAPFATHLYAKETIELPGGRQVREFPPLQYGGSHLEDPAARGRDILVTVLGAGLEGLLGWLVLSAVVIVALARRARTPLLEKAKGVVLGREATPWHVILLMAGGIILLVFLAVRLGVKYHIFGTDKVGEDVFYEALKSVRTGLVIGTLTTLVMLPFAILLGIAAGYFRGWVDDAIQYLYTTLNSIPGVLLIAAAILMLQVYMAKHSEQFDNVAVRADTRLLFLCIILGITNWTGLCRLLRAETLKLTEVEYIQAAHAFGVGHFRVITRHILPNVMHLVLISVVLDFSGLVLAEAVLSYVNIGVDPSTTSWGNMINSARLEMAREPIVWWSLAAAFLFMFSLVLSANLVSDAVRDAFDPRIKKQ